MSWTPETIKRLSRDLMCLAKECSIHNKCMAKKAEDKNNFIEHGQTFCHGANLQVSTKFKHNKSNLQ